MNDIVTEESMFATKVEALLGGRDYHQIAIQNPRQFLRSKIHPAV